MTEVHSSDGTVGKALKVLELAANFGRPTRLPELISSSPYPKATTYRLIQTLTSQNMLQFDSDRKCYALGLRLVRLAHAAWNQSSLAPIAKQHIDKLAANVGETVHLAQLDNGHVLYVDKRSSEDKLEMFSEAGRIGPAYCTGVGKAMLAFLNGAELCEALKHQAFHRFTNSTFCDKAKLQDELRIIQSSGYALDREEHEDGIICVAVPIVSKSNRVLGALSVTTSAYRNTIEQLERFVPELARTAESIAAEAASWKFPHHNQEIHLGSR